MKTEAGEQVQVYTAKHSLVLRVVDIDLWTCRSEEKNDDVTPQMWKFVENLHIREFDGGNLRNRSARLEGRA